VSATRPASDAAPVRRTAEIEEATNRYIIHPISARLAQLLARLGVHPNAVSVAGMICGVLAGVAYRHYEDARWAVLGFVLMVAWHVMDGADGQLARLTGTQSETGKVLDGICDYVTFIAVYAGLARALAPRHGAFVWGLVLAAGACHAVQAAAYEAQRQEYDFWGWGRKSAGLVLPSGTREPRLAGLLHGLYTRVELLSASPAFRERLAAILAARPERADAVRRRYREVFAPTVRRWAVLSANYRTLGIFVCAVLKVPLLYFWVEILGLSMVLAVLLAGLPARRRRLLRSLEAGV